MTSSAPAEVTPAASVTGLAILLWATEPEAPHRLVTPFFHAAAAAAFDLQVEVYFSARSVLLLQPGLATSLRASADGITVYEAMQQACEHGAVFLACADALQAHGLASTALIPECIGRGGAVQFIARASDPCWRTLVF